MARLVHGIVSLLLPLVSGAPFFIGIIEGCQFSMGLLVVGQGRRVDGASEGVQVGLSRVAGDSPTVVAEGARVLVHLA